MNDFIEQLESRELLSSDPVLRWNSILLDAIRTSQTPPPYAARNMAIVHTAIYNAVARIFPENDPYLGRSMGAKKASAPAAVAQAAYDTLSSLYPILKSTFDSALAFSLAKIPENVAKEAGIALGQKSAARILRARADDGADVIKTYTPGTTPSSWQPTAPLFAPALLPNWPDVKPFAIRKADQFRPAPPPAMTSSEFTAAFNHVKQIGEKNSTVRTADQTQIALFWADGAGTATPPGHWNLIAADIARQEHDNLPENARLFALLNIALADAGIASWDAKYFYNFCRPITAIHNAANDGNPNTTPNAQWSPLINTPPFPSYTSGHSTFSAAAATVLAGFFGTDKISFTTESENPAARSRSFGSFSQAAAEAGQSRIYAGIHWDFDNTAGLAAGRKVGQYVLAHALQPVRDLPAAVTRLRIPAAHASFFFQDFKS